MTTTVPDQLTKLNLQTLKLSVPVEYVLHVEISVNKINSMTAEFFNEYKLLFNTISNISSIRCIVVSSNSRLFTAGLDLVSANISSEGNNDPSRVARQHHLHIKHYQDAFTAQELCVQPVIVCCHSAVIGGGIDLITAADIRLCSEDTYFSVKEVDIGLAADLGTLQRLPKVIGNQSLVRELAYTARKLSSSEALQHGLVSKVFKDKAECVKAGIEMATLISSKSPVAIYGTKKSLVYARDHNVQDSLDMITMFNAAMLQSDDVKQAIKATLKKKQPIFSNL